MSTTTETTIPEGTIPTLTLGWRLRMSMAAAGKNTSDMAEALEMDRSTISLWVNDRAVPKKTWYLRIWAEATGVDLGWLTEGGGTLPKEPKGQERKPLKPRGRAKGGRKGFAVPYRNAYGGHGYSDRSAPLAS